MFSNLILQNLRVKNANEEARSDLVTELCAIIFEYHKTDAIILNVKSGPFKANNKLPALTLR